MRSRAFPSRSELTELLKYCAFFAHVGFPKVGVVGIVNGALSQSQPNCHLSTERVKIVYVQYIFKLPNMKFMRVASRLLGASWDKLHMPIKTPKQFKNTANQTQQQNNIHYSSPAQRKHNKPKQSKTLGSWWLWGDLGLITSKWLVCPNCDKPCRQRSVILVGLEPTIPSSVGRFLIHWATGPSNLERPRIVY